MKTINFLTGNFIPENCAGTNRILALVKELEKKYKINVICISEKGKKPNDFKFSENISVYYVYQTKEYDSEKFFTRAIHEFWYALKLALKSNRFPSDMVIATSPQMFIIPTVALFTRGKKIIDIRDLVWEYIDAKSLYTKAVKITLTALMKASILRYRYITVTNNHEYEWIIKNIQNAGDKIEKITNGIEIYKFEELKSIGEKEVQPFTLTYIGNVGIAQNIKVLVDIAKRIPDMQINIVGEGNKYKELKEYARKNRINNITFFGKVHRDKIIDFYQNSSVLFAQLDEKFKAAMPSKLYEYAATGLPIIYGGLGEARKFVNGLENATTIDPGDVKALEIAIKKYKESPVKISEKNRKLIYENFIREKQSQKMVDIVDKLLGES
jgi:glycosyltransferase involved in cell wall biosynthesis